ncbi:T9SS type A sorting domain-containing protein, partial [Maribacter arcticus]|uniref:T9SS type A sorting domain-containing protein n=1 Tax=Maribacter arcticus TaxID=561365 RepID=UPI00300277AD
GDGYAVAPTAESCTSPGTGYTQNILPLTDCDDNDPNVFEVSTWYLDADGDNYAVAPTVESCNSPGIGYTQNVLPLTDCDDTDPNVFEVSIWYLDADGDGYTTYETIESCNSPGIDYNLIPSDKIDCDDENEQINPETIWRLDADEDGSADNEEFVVDCTSPGAGFTNNILVPYSISDKIIAYPNPTTEAIIIDLGEIKSAIKLTLVNSSKKLVLTKNFQSQRFLTIDLSALASGVYFVEIINQKEVIGTHKIIKL